MADTGNVNVYDRKIASGSQYGGSYRSWLQELANAGDLAGQEASALLQVVGDDGGVDQRFLADPYAFTGRETGHVAVPAYDSGELFGYGPEGVQRLNNIFYNSYNSGADTRSGGGAGGYSGGGGDSGADQANEVAYWGDQIELLNRLIDSTRVQKGQGLDRIGNTYKTAKQRTEEKRDAGLAQYGTQRTDTLQDKVKTFGGIDTATRTAWEGLQRLFGLGNAGVSSAAKVLAPTALSRQATQQRTRANDTYGRNLRDIDTAQTSFEGDVGNALTDLLNQKNTNTEDFLRGILGQEASLQQQLIGAQNQKTIAGGGTYLSAQGARAPFQNRLGQIQNQLDNLFNKYGNITYNPQQVQADIPNLAQYTYDPIRVQAAQSNPTVDQSLLPYYPSIRDRDQNRLF